MATPTTILGEECVLDGEDFRNIGKVHASAKERQTCSLIDSETGREAIHNWPTTLNARTFDPRARESEQLHGVFDAIEAKVPTWQSDSNLAERA